MLVTHKWLTNMNYFWKTAFYNNFVLFYFEKKIISALLHSIWNIESIRCIQNTAPDLANIRKCNTYSNTFHCLTNLTVFARGDIIRSVEGCVTHSPRYCYVLAIRIRAQRSVQRKTFVIKLLAFKSPLLSINKFIEV